MNIIVDNSDLYDSYQAGIYIARLGILNGLINNRKADEKIAFYSRRHPLSARRPSPEIPAGDYQEIFSYKRQCSNIVDVLGGIKEDIRQLKTDAKILKNNGCDIFFMSEKIWPNVSGSKFFAYIHDLTPIQFPHLHPKRHCLLFKWRMNYLKDKCEHVFVNSDTTRKVVKDILRFPDEKIWTVYLSADKCFSPADKLYSKKLISEIYSLPDRPMILSVSTLEPRKNIKNIVEAFKLLVKEGRWDEKNKPILVLVGSDGWHKDNFYSYLYAECLKGDIFKVGEVTRKMLVHFYRACEFSVYIPFFEGFGLPPLEAMATAKPVIASNISAIREVIGDFVYLVEPDSIAEIKKAMQRLLGNKDLSGELAVKGLRRASQFSWDKAGKRILDIFRWSLGQGEHPSQREVLGT